MTLPAKNSAQWELIRKIQFHPVFDEYGQLLAIDQLKVNTDRRNGIRAMRELLETSEPHDDIILPTGLTARQTRILETAAPMSAHYLKPTRKWDASTGEFVPTVSILLPYEVVWVLFESLFAGQFSIKINEVACTTEDVFPAAPVDGMTMDDAPGRLYFTHARVTLTLHLANGQSRSYEGFGVSYDHVRMQKTGNIYALNSSRRMAEKGAITDAKRDALSNLGPVFRLAFEDGDEMIEKLEEMLLAQLAEVNSNPRSVTPEASPVPQRQARTTQAPDQPAPPDLDGGDYIPEHYARHDELRNQKDDRSPAPGPDEAGSATGDTKPEPIGNSAPDKTGIEEIQDEILAAPDPETANALIGKYQDALLRGDPSSQTLDEIRTMVMETFQPEGDAISQSEEAADGVETNTSATDPQWLIACEGKTSTTILRAFIAKFKKAKTSSDLDQIVETNGAAARLLNPTHMVEMANAQNDRRNQLSG